MRSCTIRRNRVEVAGEFGRELYRLSIVSDLPQIRRQDAGFQLCKAGRAWQHRQLNFVNVQLSLEHKCASQHSTLDDIGRLEYYYPYSSIYSCIMTPEVPQQGT